MSGGNTQYPEDKPHSLGDVTVEEKNRSGKNTVDANKEAVEVNSLHCIPSLVADKKMCSQPDSEREEEEQPGRPLTCLEIPDFLLPEGSEDNSGKNSICQMLLLTCCF